MNVDIENYECLICHNMYKRRSLSNHIHSKHNLKAKEYYDSYIEPNIKHLCICGKPTKFKNIFDGYTKHCSRKCSSLDPIVQTKLKATNQIKYGIDFYWQTPELIEKSHTKEVRQKASISCQNTWNNKYGCHPMKTTECKEKLKTTNQSKYGTNWIVESNYFKEKVKENSIKNYGTNWPNQSEQIKQSIKQKNLEKLGVDHYMKDPSKRKNIYKVISKHNTEIECYNYLCSIYDTVFHNYKSDLYPFKCDFYIPKIDTYIELNFFIVHGGHAYNEYNQEDILKLNELKEKAKSSDFYKRYIEIWTKSDPFKKQTAINNNLNYLVFYTKEDFYNHFKYKEEN